MTTAAEIERKLLSVATDMYREPNERAAMRGALMDAAGLLDAIATDIGREHFKRGRITNEGQKLALVVTRAADALMAMREKINVPQP